MIRQTMLFGMHSSSIVASISQLFMLSSKKHVDLLGRDLSHFFMLYILLLFILDIMHTATYILKTSRIDLDHWIHLVKSWLDRVIHLAVTTMSSCIVEGTMFGSITTTAMSPKNFLNRLLILFWSSLATSTPLHWSFYILQQICAYLQSSI